MGFKRVSTLLSTILAFLFCIDTSAQNGPDSLLIAPTPLDSLVIAQDSLLFQDSLLLAEKSAIVKGSIDRPAFSTARDSVIEVFKEGQKVVYYFGDVTATYGDLSIKSDYMSYNLDLNTLFARGTRDTIANEIIGMPEMSDGKSTYQMEELYYNFNTKKAKIKNMATQQDDGKLVGDNLKMMPDKSINISGGKYTVCDAEHPHYYLRMTAAKVITEPKQKTVFGPAYPVIADVPIPIALPFGFVPEMPDRASGILIPTYGEETARGLYLRDFGYSFVIGDYVDLAFTGDIYSYGSWAARVTSRYNVKYKFNGSLSINYSNDITGERGEPDFTQSTNFGVTWSHSQDSKARPGTSFKASVNFSSPSNNRYNTQSINEGLQNQMSSSISYSRTWTNVNFSINALHSQNSRDSSYAVTLPNFTLSVNRFYPFKNNNRVGKERVWEKISLSYSTTLQNKVNFKLNELLNDPASLVNKMSNGMTHSFAIGLPSFTLLKYLNFSPSVSYGMNWFFREQQVEYDPESDKIIQTLSDQFSTFGVSQSFSAGISMSTRLYGMFNFGNKGKLQAIRHMITPSFSFSWQPEMGVPMNGYMTYNYVDKNGVTKSHEYNKYSGMLYSPPGKGKRAALSFSFGNNLEAKIRNDQDTAENATKKVKLLDQLNIGGSYNFLAEQFKLSNISISGSTTIFGKLGLNGNMSVDPYAIDEKGARINTLNVVKTGVLGRLTNASLSTSYSFSGGGKYEGNDGHTSSIKDEYARIYYHPITGEYIPGGWVYYLNPNIPWSLNLSYSYSYTKAYQYTNETLQVKNNHIQTLGISGQVRLTPAMNISVNSGLDITKMALATTQVSATYDLHCFAISVSWVPTGQWQSWSFRIAAKASALADIMQFKKASSYWDNQ